MQNDNDNDNDNFDFISQKKKSFFYSFFDKSNLFSFP